MKPYDSKSILIIGAGLLQVPVIKTANELGLKTIVTDYNIDAPGMKIADHPVVISIKDIDGTVRVIKQLNKKIKIDGVITSGTDASMTVAAVANALNLPGIPFENAEAASNKFKMRKRLLEHNVPIPKFFKCWSFDDLLNISKELNYPFVIKPVDNMGARGVMKIDNEALLHVAFDNAKKGSPSGELIVEEYMEGSELSIDSIVYHDQIKITGIADRIIAREPYFIELGHILPSNQPENVLENAVDVFKQAIKAIGITLGAAKGDIKLTKEGAKIVEIAARLSGGFMSAYTYPYATGVNLIRIAIDLSLGIEPLPQLFIPTKNRISIEKAIIPKPGVIKEINGVNEALSIHGIMNVFTRVNIGDEIFDPKSNVEKAGNIIAVKDTREEALKTIEEAEKFINILTEPFKVLSWDTICHKARERFNRACYVCNVCNGVECRGKMPGIGGIGNGNAFIRNYKDLNKILIKTRIIHNIKDIDTSCDFFHVKLSLPLIAAPISGCDINLGGNITELEYDLAIVEGCKDNGIIGFVGDRANDNLYKIGLEAIKNVNGYGGIIFKPHEDQNELKKRLNEAKNNNVKFVGIDIDASAFLKMKSYNQNVSPKTFEQLLDLRESTGTPFIIKGIMTIDDALLSIKSGADAIVVSNHGGRITDNHPSSISVLREISEAVKGKIKIIFDGGIRSGEDIFKAIALGADYVMIGRPFAIAVMGGEKIGINILINRYKEELEKIMLITGCRTIYDIKEDLIITPDFRQSIYIQNGRCYN
ncbi:MAG: ATP-grasp domain-containing protein [Spirochaetes bacterium]|nr:ATP-grasp domain-containing protein [Spirochaetota bacterium]